MERYIVIDANWGTAKWEKKDCFGKVEKIKDKIIEIGNKNGDINTKILVKVKLRSNFGEI